MTVAEFDAEHPNGHVVAPAADAAKGTAQGAKEVVEDGEKAASNGELPGEFPPPPPTTLRPRLHPQNVPFGPPIRRY